jgi:hypothetical protein
MWPTQEWTGQKDCPSVYVVGSFERVGECMGEERTGNNRFLGMVDTMNYPLGSLGRCAMKV